MNHEVLKESFCIPNFKKCKKTHWEEWPTSAILQMQPRKLSLGEKEMRERLFAIDRSSDRLIKKEKPGKLMENVGVTPVFCTN